MWKLTLTSWHNGAANPPSRSSRTPSLSAKRVDGQRARSTLTLGGTYHERLLCEERRNVSPIGSTVRLSGFVDSGGAVISSASPSRPAPSSCRAEGPPAARLPLRTRIRCQGKRSPLPRYRGFFTLPGESLAEDGRTVGCQRVKCPQRTQWTLFLVRAPRIVITGYVFLFI
jgi:hypothetical protein